MAFRHGKASGRGRRYRLFLYCIIRCGSKVVDGKLSRKTENLSADAGLLYNMVKKREGVSGMTASKYRVLTKVVEEKSITRAAEDLNYTQSGVSHIIKSIEKDLGFKILFRNNTDVSLTPEGKAIYGTVKSIADEEERLFQYAGAVNSLQMGHISVGTCCSISALWLPEIIKGFLSLYPKIEFYVRDGDYDETEEMLEKNVLDCAFLPKPNSASILHMHLHDDPYYAVVPDGHPWGKLRQVSAADFHGESFIVPCEGLNYSIGRWFRENKIRPVINIRARDDLGTLAFVKAGLGVTILSEMYLKSAGSKAVDGLKTVRLQGGMARDVGIALHKGRELSPALHTFCSYIEAWAEKTSILG